MADARARSRSEADRDGGGGADPAGAGRIRGATEGFAGTAAGRGALHGGGGGGGPTGDRSRGASEVPQRSVVVSGAGAGAGSRWAAAGSAGSAGGGSLKPIGNPLGELPGDPLDPARYASVRAMHVMLVASGMLPPVRWRDSWPRPVMLVARWWIPACIFVLTVLRSCKALVCTRADGVNMTPFHARAAFLQFLIPIALLTGAIHFVARGALLARVLRAQALIKDFMPAHHPRRDVYDDELSRVNRRLSRMAAAALLCVMVVPVALWTVPRLAPLFSPPGDEGLSTNQFPRACEQDMYDKAGGLFIVVSVLADFFGFYVPVCVWGVLLLCLGITRRNLQLVVDTLAGALLAVVRDVPASRRRAAPSVSSSEVALDDAGGWGGPAGGGMEWFGIPHLAFLRRMDELGNVLFRFLSTEIMMIMVLVVAWPFAAGSSILVYGVDNRIGKFDLLVFCIVVMAVSVAVAVFAKVERNQRALQTTVTQHEDPSLSSRWREAAELGDVEMDTRPHIGSVVASVPDDGADTHLLRLGTTVRQALQDQRTETTAYSVVLWAHVGEYFVSLAYAPLVGAALLGTTALRAYVAHPQCSDPEIAFSGSTSSPLRCSGGAAFLAIVARLAIRTAIASLPLFIGASLSRRWRASAAAPSFLRPLAVAVAAHSILVVSLLSSGLSSTAASAALAVATLLTLLFMTELVARKFSAGVGPASAAGAYRTAVRGAVGALVAAALLINYVLLPAYRSADSDETRLVTVLVAMPAARQAVESAIHFSVGRLLSRASRPPTAFAAYAFAALPLSAIGRFFLGNLQSLSVQALAVVILAMLEFSFRATAHLRRRFMWAALSGCDLNGRAERKAEEFRTSSYHSSIIYLRMAAELSALLFSVPGTLVQESARGVERRTSVRDLVLSVLLQLGGEILTDLFSLHAEEKLVQRNSLPVWRRRRWRHLAVALLASTVAFAAIASDSASSD